MRKKITSSIAALMLCLAGPLLADTLAIKPGAPETYVVKEGDTLWDISGMYLDQPWLWPDLWKLNPQVENPHLIYPGDVLSLTYDAAGKPVLSLNDKVVKLTPSDEPNADGEIVAEIEAEQAAEDSLNSDRPEGYKKVSPTARKRLKSGKAITTLPLTMIRPFLTYEQALTEDKIAALPYIVGTDDGVKNATNGHLLYVKGQLEQGAAYAVYRKGKAYIDPQTEEVLGYETKLVATARVLRAGNSSTNEAATVMVSDVRQEIRQGDRLLPAADGQSLPAFFVMQRPETPVDGTIISSTTALREFSKWDIVVLNRGELDDLKPGHMYGIYRNSPTVVDSKDGPVYLDEANRLQKLTGGMAGNQMVMPREKVGQLMIFKVSERTSFAIVTSTLKPVRVGDLISGL